MILMGRRGKDHPAIILLMTIYSFDKYLLNICYLLDIVLGTGDKAVSKSGKVSLPSCAACILVGEDNNNQDK